MAARPGVRTVPRVMRSAPLVPLFVALLAAQSGLLVLGPVLPDVAAEFGISTAAAGQLRAVSGAAGAVAGVVTAVWGRRLDLGVVVRAGLALLLAGGVLSAAAPSLAVLAGAQAAVGAGVGIAVAAAMAAASAWSEPEGRARAVAAVALGQPVAWIVGQPLAGVLGTLGWRWVWLAGPVLAAAIALMVMPKVGEPPAPSEADATRGPGGLRWWVAGELAAFTAWAGLLVFVATLIRVRHEVSPATAGLVLGACSAAYLPAGIWAGRLTPTGRRRAVPALAGACAVLATALGFADGPLPLTVAIFTALVAAAAARQVASSVDGLALSAHPLAAMGLRASCMQVGYLAGAAAGGAALAVAGPAGLGVWAAGAFALSTVITVAHRRSSDVGKKPAIRGVHPRRPTPPPEEPMPISPITIRPAMPADTGVLRDLAALDARPELRGPVLLAEARGRPVAAIAMDDGAVAADPFRRSAAAVALLRTQRELVRQERRERGRSLSVVPRLRVA